MRPTEFYALPTIQSEPWHRVYGSLVTLFEDESLEYGLDRKRAEEEAGGLSFERKLFDGGDGERTIAYEAAVLGGKPFAIVVRSGRGGEDNQDRFITDLDTFKAAKAYVDRWRTEASSLDRDVVDPGEDLDILHGTYGHAVMATGGVIRLVDVDHLDDKGNLLFDEKAFSDAFDRLVRPAFTVDGDEFRQGIRGSRMRELAVPALLEAVPEGIRATADFEPIPKVDGLTPINGWSPVLLGSDEGTFVLGLLGASEGYFSWARSVRAEKVGPPELYDELARAVAPKP